MTVFLTCFVLIFLLFDDIVTYLNAPVLNNDHLHLFYAQMCRFCFYFCLKLNLDPV